MKFFKKNISILFVVIVIASALRLWNLGNVPISLDWDEVALGYNAFSIAETGKDEYGNSHPVVLRSFEDYKPALYSYIAIPSIKIFGLNAFGVRLPSAILGILSVLIVYFLIKYLFQRNDLALLSSFFLAVAPFHIQFSRTAFEANLGLTLNLLAITFFLVGLKKHKLLFFAPIFSALSIYSYQSEKVFVPIMAIVLVALFRKELLKVSKKYLFGSIIIGIILCFPLIFVMTQSPESLTRVKGASSLFNTQAFLGQLYIDRIGQNVLADNYIGNAIFDNRRIYYAKQITHAYLSHFDLNFLFVTGDQIERFQPPGTGKFLLWELPFMAFGLFWLIFGQFPKRVKMLLFSWILITPIPASITWDVPNSVRILNILPIPQIIAGIGLIGFFDWISKLSFRSKVLRKNAKPLFIAMVLFAAVLNFAYYLNQYFVQYNYFSAKSWQYGYEELVPYLQENEKNYERIVVSTKIPLDQSYIFFLFYLKFPPAEYQKFSTQFSGEYLSSHTFGKFEFRDFNWNDEKRTKKTLYVGSLVNFPAELRSIKTIYFPNGEEAFKLVESDSM